MRSTPCLGFDGACAEATRREAATFGADDPRIMTFDEAPAEAGMPPLGDRVMHAQVSPGGAVPMAADPPPGRFVPMQGSAGLHATPPAEGG
jgi:uncharacterized glyoxalase superfamily protein PhnB